eukprot:TRINITY_DN67442_c2_g8_i1.p1 TRINITY_DN67442_c2_g8~~TRINITY_DN67442_c2_g8_i1.p1  ORF type:complete len:834 (-),score=75.17 TRINITY_DN67442_c2_g8_i1:735-3236(-)
MPKVFGWALPPKDVDELSITDVKQVHAIFKQLDIDNNGALSFEEAAAVQELVRGEELTAALFKKMDANDSGYATYEEVLHFWFPRLRKADIDRYLKLFLQPDEILQLCTVFNRLADIDGWLPVSSMVLGGAGHFHATSSSTVAGLLGLQLTENAIRHLGSDKLSFREFLEILHPGIPQALLTRYCSTTIPQEDFLHLREIVQQLDKARRGYLMREEFHRMHLAAVAARVDPAHSSPRLLKNNPRAFPRLDDMDIDLIFFDYVDRFQTGKMSLQSILQALYPLIPKWELLQMCSKHDLTNFTQQHKHSQSQDNWTETASPTSQQYLAHLPQSTNNQSPLRPFGHPILSSGGLIIGNGSRGASRERPDRSQRNMDSFGKLPSLVPRTSTHNKTTQTVPTLTPTAPHYTSPRMPSARPGSSGFPRRVLPPAALPNKPSTANPSGAGYASPTGMERYASWGGGTNQMSRSPPSPLQQVGVSSPLSFSAATGFNASGVTASGGPLTFSIAVPRSKLNKSADSFVSNDDEVFEVVTITEEALADYLPQKVVELVKENDELKGRLQVIEDEKDAQINDLQQQITQLQADLEKVASIKNLIQERVGVIQKKFTYTKDYDTHGFLHFLATRGGIKDWENPIAADLVKVHGSFMDTINVNILGERPTTLGPEQDRKMGISVHFEPTFSSTSKRWLILDLGASLDITHYTLSSLCPTNNTFGECYGVSWTLEGCKKGGKGERGEIWDLLSQHVDCTLLCGAAVHNTWKILSKGRAYRYFRLTVNKILQVTPPPQDTNSPKTLFHAYNNSNDESWQTLFPFGGIEFYGLCVDLPCQYFGIESGVP